MKGSLGQANPHNLHLSLSSVCANHPLFPRQSFIPGNVKVPWISLGFRISHSWPNHASCLVQRRTDNGFMVGCASWGLKAELERELEAEMNQQEGEEMGKFRHKCGERKGVVELLECLEKEAIMGEDVGKEPVDYNRRAQIFDRSSKVFQALGELNNDVLSHQSSK